jgi:hypothetical protein
MAPHTESERAGMTRHHSESRIETVGYRISLPSVFQGSFALFPHGADGPPAGAGGIPKILLT